MHSAKTTWLWVLTGRKGERHGYVTAVDPRDAVSRALTSDVAPGRLLGETLGETGFDVLHDAPGNGDSKFTGNGAGFALSVKRVACPEHIRGTEHVDGCGSTNVSGPDEEGFFDCRECGARFNPLLAD
ncbi:hypothetical protein [Paraburkholderia sp. A3RO-2L]|uniref:hypothetical protein n=1 Tax=unclassified Paraburkholderia TaxID=2615204 RepID=UPI0032F211B5|nr:hypothetical protein [Burkholderia vietnamiensis]